MLAIASPDHIDPARVGPCHEGDPVRKLVAALVIVALWGLGAVAPAAAASWSPGTASSWAESQARSLVQSAHVAACGRSLAVSTPMTDLARWRAKDMVVRAYYSHTIAGTGRHVWDYFGAYRVAARQGAEVLVWNNYPVDLSPASAVQQWMLSASHRAIITSCGYDTFGIGTYEGPTGKKMYVGIFGVSTATATVARGTRAVVVGSLALRSGPGTRYAVRAYEARGSRLTVTRTSGGWLAVRDARGRTGWVWGAYTR